MSERRPDQWGATENARATPPEDLGRFFLEGVIATQDHVEGG